MVHFKWVNFIAYELNLSKETMLIKNSLFIGAKACICSSKEMLASQTPEEDYDKVLYGDGS